MTLHIRWIVHDLKYLGQSDTYKTTLQLAFHNYKSFPEEYLLQQVVDFVPADGEQNQVWVFKIPPHQIRNAYSSRKKYLVVKMKKYRRTMSLLMIPLSQIKFSFHTNKLFDQKGNCCYASLQARCHFSRVLWLRKTWNGKSLRCSEVDNKDDLWLDFSKQKSTCAGVYK